MKEYLMLDLNVVYNQRVLQEDKKFYLRRSTFSSEMPDYDQLGTYDFPQVGRIEIVNRRSQDICYQLWSMTGEYLGVWEDKIQLIRAIPEFIDDPTSSPNIPNSPNRKDESNEDWTRNFIFGKTDRDRHDREQWESDLSKGATLDYAHKWMETARQHLANELYWQERCRCAELSITTGIDVTIKHLTKETHKLERQRANHIENNEKLVRDVQEFYSQVEEMYSRTTIYMKLVIKNTSVPNGDIQQSLLAAESAIRNSMNWVREWALNHHLNLVG